jgi:hypothetical protein
MFKVKYTISGQKNGVFIMKQQGKNTGKMAERSHSQQSLKGKELTRWIKANSLCKIFLLV